jgi:hypothetical protein
MVCPCALYWQAKRQAVYRLGNEKMPIIDRREKYSQTIPLIILVVTFYQIYSPIEEFLNYIS